MRALRIAVGWTGGRGGEPTVLYCGDSQGKVREVANNASARFVNVAVGHVLLKSTVRRDRRAPVDDTGAETGTAAIQVVDDHSVELANLREALEQETARNKELSDLLADARAQAARLAAKPSSGGTEEHKGPAAGEETAAGASEEVGAPELPPVEPVEEPAKPEPAHHGRRRQH